MCLGAACLVIYFIGSSGSAQIIPPGTSDWKTQAREDQLGIHCTWPTVLWLLRDIECVDGTLYVDSRVFVACININTVSALAMVAFREPHTQHTQVYVHTLSGDYCQL